MRFAAAMLVFSLMPAAILAQDSRQAYLQQFDCDGNGRVDEAEYLAYMSRSFFGMDANGDSVLETSELPGASGREITLSNFQSNLRAQFHKLDRNHDGLLNRHELTAPPG